jgi:protein-disulfide isomerase
MPFLMVAFVLAVTCAACDRSGAGAEAPKPSALAPRDAGVEPPAPPAKEKAGLEVPGMDFSTLSPSAQQELQSVFSDEFCYCGCPHTLGACLKEHTSCRHAKRMATLAAGEAAAGVPSTEIIVLLSQYYLSFSEPRVKFEPDPRMCMGAGTAKVTLVEFSDFECPYCAAARPILENFARKNPDVRFCFAPFPLGGHPNALPAAQAVMFARDKGKFWELHDALFENQRVLSREKILELGGKVGLNKEELAKALDAGAYLEELQRMKELGRTAGVDATPTVYVNGRKLVLPLGPETLRHTVDDELEWSAHGGAWAKD